MLRLIVSILLVSGFLFSCSSRIETPEGFQIEPGFSLELVAIEPLIKDPVDLEFNELGDALVLEMPGYPFEDKQSRILVLKDRDNDGVYDEKIPFIENLQLANSFMPYKKGVLVAAPPYLLFVHDDDQNYVPEKTDTLMGGFSTGNLQHNYNGLTLGLDNWIYAANGGNDGAPYWWSDTTTRMDLRGQDFRFDLETKTLERLGESSGGFGFAIDEYGRVFETHNLTHISHLVFADRYIQGKQILQEHALENISDHDENGLARIYPIGEQESRVNHPEQSGYFSGSCGITYYGGGAFGDAYNNTVWVADVVLNLIHVDKIKPNGASFTATRVVEKRDFMASTDRAFRPVNMSVGPDGAMYVVDMYRKVIEHPEWIPDDIEKTLDLDGGKDQGRIYRITKEGVKGNFEVSQFKTQEGLVKSLEHPNQWVRKTAHRLLMEKNLSKGAIDALQGLLARDDYSRLHALHLLANARILNDSDLIKILSDKNPNIQESALVIAERSINTNTALASTCLSLLNSKSDRVRMQAGLTLSTIERKSKVFENVEKEIFDPILRAAHSSIDEWTIAAITLAAQNQSADLFAILSQSDQISSKLLVSLALQSSQSAEGFYGVLKNLSSPTIKSNDQKLIVQQLIKNANPANARSIEPLIKLLEQSSNITLLPELAALRNKLKLPASPEFLKYSQVALKQVLDTAVADSMRMQQLALLDLLPYSAKADVLFSCLKNNQPLKLQEGALRQLANYPEKEIGQRVVAMWNELSPQTRRYSSDLLLYIEIHHDALLTGLENKTINVGEMNFDLERRRQLLWWTDNENTKRRAEKLFTDSGVANRQEAINKMKPALTLAGSSANGAKVFETVCGNCHQYGSRGIEVGPTLTEIGRKSKETLTHDILDPNAAADPKYINHRLELKDGKVHMGIVAAETDQTITIKKMGGESVTISKGDIKSFRSLGTSLMMEGLESAITPQEMADLLVFLQHGAQ